MAADGLGAVSVRALAGEVGTTTRAIYSLFGSKDGLIAALGARTFDLLAAAVDALPTTHDPGADLVEAGVNGFRRLVVDHPALFQLGIQQTHATDEQLVEIRAAAARAWTVLQARVTRIQHQGRLGTRSVEEAATAFHALCEGLAALEPRCPSYYRGRAPLARRADRPRRRVQQLRAVFGHPAAADSRAGATATVTRRTGQPSTWP